MDTLSVNHQAKKSVITPEETADFIENKLNRIRKRHRQQPALNEAAEKDLCFDGPSKPCKQQKKEHDKEVRNDLLDPHEVDRFLEENKFDNNWVNEDCVALPFGNRKTTSQAEKAMYDLLRFVGEKFDEDMYIVHTYQHQKNRGIQINTHSKAPVIKVDEIDFVVIHKKFGPMLFEVKQMVSSKLPVTVVDINDQSITVPKLPNVLCPVEMITKGEDQLVLRWDQIKQYLKEFFVIPNVGSRWMEYFNERSQQFHQFTTIDELIKSICSDTHSRSFLCLFEYTVTQEGPTTFFECKNPICANTIEVKNVTILTNHELKDEASFSSWWKNTIRNRLAMIAASSVHYIMINRIVMDHVLSLFYKEDKNLLKVTSRIEKNDRSLREKSIKTKAELEKAELELKKNGEKFLIPSLRQLEVCIDGEKQLCIKGPAGTGKTVVLIQKVKNLVFKLCNEASVDQQSRPAKNHPTILVLCYNIPLRELLFQHLKEDANAMTKKLKQTLLVLTVDSFLAKFFQCSYVLKDKLNRNNEYVQFTDRYLLDAFESKVRVPHIFIDESHDISFELMKFFYTKIFHNYQNNGHFWMFLDPCQNVKRNHLLSAEFDFPIRHLNQVYRACQQQFLFMEKLLSIDCDECRSLRAEATTSRMTNRCDYCTPVCCVKESGPRPIGVTPNCRDIKLVQEFHDENLPGELSLSLIRQALIKAWRNFAPDELNDADESRTFSILRSKKFLSRTTVLVTDDKLASRLIKQLNRKVGHGTACNAQFFEMKKRAVESIRIESFLRFKGLDAAVVIVLDDPRRHLDSIVLTRAMSLTVVIANKDRLKDLGVSE